MTPVSAHRPAIVVGAGPVGLTAALALRVRGVPATVLEADPADRVRPGSRAIYLHGATLRILERLHPGLGRTVAAHGLVWPTKRTLFRGREVYRRTYPAVPDGELPPLTSLPQVRLEELLLDACRDAGVELVWDTPVAQVEVDDGAVSARSDAGSRWTAAYLVGADGARSHVRRGVGAQLRGSRSDVPFIVVDVAEDPDDPLPAERVFHYRHPAVGGRNVLLVPFQGGWRVDLQCRPDDDLEALTAPDAVRSWVGRVLPRRYGQRITWVSSYRFLQVVADRFVDERRRVLLAGEAAHLFAPFGARGLNSGVSDADAAAAAVQQACGATRPAVARHAVEAYQRDRLDAARWNREAAGRALAHLRADDPLTRVAQWAAAALAPAVERAGRWLDAAPYGPRLRPGRSRVTY